MWETLFDRKFAIEYVTKQLAMELNTENFALKLAMEFNTENFALKENMAWLAVHMGKVYLSR